MNRDVFLELIYKYIHKNNNITVKNIKSINQDIDVADCYMYVIDKINFFNYENGKLTKSILFLEVRNKLKDYFRIVKKEKYLELEFNKYFKCISENFSELTPPEKIILIHMVNNNFRKFLDFSFLKKETARYRDKYISSIQKKLKTKDVLKIVAEKFESYKDFSYNVGGNYNSLLYGESNTDNLD